MQTTGPSILSDLTSFLRQQGGADDDICDDFFSLGTASEVDRLWMGAYLNTKRSALILSMLSKNIEDSKLKVIRHQQNCEGSLLLSDSTSALKKQLTDLFSIEESIISKSKELSLCVEERIQAYQARIQETRLDRDKIQTDYSDSVEAITKELNEFTLRKKSSELDKRTILGEISTLLGDMETSEKVYNDQFKGIPVVDFAVFDATCAEEDECFFMTQEDHVEEVNRLLVVEAMKKESLVALSNKFDSIIQALEMNKDLFNAQKEKNDISNSTIKKAVKLKASLQNQCKLLDKRQKDLNERQNDLKQLTSKALEKVARYNNLTKVFEDQISELTTN